MSDQKKEGGRECGVDVYVVSRYRDDEHGDTPKQQTHANHHHHDCEDVLHLRATILPVVIEVIVANASSHLIYLYKLFNFDSLPQDSLNIE